MESIDIKAFRKLNNLTQTDLGDYLGCTKAFISAIEKGLRPLPDEMYSKLIDNSLNWDVSMLTQPKNVVIEQPQSDPFMSYLISEVENLKAKVERLQNEKADLREENGRLKEALELARKGETASHVGTSSAAHVG